MSYVDEYDGYFLLSVTVVLTTDRNIHYGGEEDWAAKARAWATADSTTENHHAHSQFTQLGRRDEHEYAYHDHLPKVLAPAVENQVASLPISSNSC